MEANLNWLTDPAVFQINRLDAHSDHVCYASAEEAERGESSLRQSLGVAVRVEPQPRLPPRGFLAGGL